MKKITLLDGGLGQEIHKRAGAAAHPLWSAKVMMDRPEMVKAVHQDFIKAGARIITVNSYTATPTRLRRDGEPAWFEKLQQQAISMALAARDELGSTAEDVQVAGCLPPLFGSYVPDERSPAALKEEYELIVALQAPHVDLFLIETIASIKEGKAATEAALESGMPVCLSFTLSDEFPDQLRSGESLEEALEAVSGYSLSALLFNCSFPETIGQGLAALKHLDIPYGGYANGFSSVAPLHPGGTVDLLSAREDLDERKYASHALDWINKGATVVGGCCEVGPSYIDYLQQQLRAAGYAPVSLADLSDNRADPSG